MGLGGEILLRERLDLVDDEQGQLAAPLGVAERLILLEREVIVIFILAREKLEAHAGLRIPAIDVKLDAVFTEDLIALDRVATGPKKPRQQIAAVEFGECLGHR